MADQSAEELREILRNYVANSERDRLQAAERHYEAHVDLMEELSKLQAKKREREQDLLDVLEDASRALEESIPHAEKESKYPFRKILARVDAAIRAAGERE